MAANIDEYLQSIYYDPSHPASFSGLDKLYRYVKSIGKNISKGIIKKWLIRQAVYNAHKAVRRKFKQQRVVVPRKFYQFDVDTISMKRYKKQNNGYNYILVMIDVMSKFCWTYPLKTLQGVEMVKALSSLISQKVTKIRSDGGSEFDNQKVKEFMKIKKIDHFLTLNEQKANIAERMIKTLKSRLVKYMQHMNSHEWVKVLLQITAGYNKSYHRSIKMSPNDALNTDDITLWNTLYLPPADKKPVVTKVAGSKKKKKNPYKYKVGDIVKLSYFKGAFTKEYDEKWTNENFIITSRSTREGLPQYTIKSWDNTPIKGRFYSQELQRIELPDGDNAVYKIESILKKRKWKGKTQHFVKWLGWPKSYNSWVDAKELKDI